MVSLDETSLWCCSNPNWRSCIHVVKSTPRPKITLSMVIHNEADKHLAYVLSKHREYIDEAVIIDDGSTDNSMEICHEVLKGIPLHLVSNTTSQFSRNEVALRKQQWQETIRREPEWILNMDADEVFEDGFLPNAHALLSTEKGDVPSFLSYFRVKHLGWATDTIRQEKYARYKLLDPSATYGWKEQYESILDPEPRLVPWKE